MDRWEGAKCLHRLKIIKEFFPLPISISSSLWHVVNIFAAGKAPKELSIYLSGATLTALSKNKPNCPPDVRPITVGEVLRRLTSKYLCHQIKDKAAQFFTLSNLWWPTHEVLKKNPWTKVLH